MAYELPLEDLVSVNEELDSKYRELMARLEHEYEKAYTVGDMQAFEMLRDAYILADRSRRHIYNYIKIKKLEKDNP